MALLSRVQFPLATQIKKTGFMPVLFNFDDLELNGLEAKQAENDVERRQIRASVGFGANPGRGYFLKIKKYPSIPSSHPKNK